MATIDRKELEWIAKLAKVDCTEDEFVRFEQNLTEILGYIEQLDKLDTEGVLPCAQVVEGSINVYREDVVQDSLDREEFLKNSPSHIGGMIRVPQVIKS